MNTTGANRTEKKPYGDLPAIPVIIITMHTIAERIMARTNSTLITFVVTNSVNDRSKRATKNPLFSFIGISFRFDVCYVSYELTSAMS